VEVGAGVDVGTGEEVLTRRPDWAQTQK
jgi:hypothetical protein